MKIAIDCRHLESGVGVYLSGCLRYFLETDNEFLLIDGGAYKYSCKCDIKPFSLKELFLFPRSILKEINKCDVYYSPYFNIPCGIKIPIAITIHDIIFYDMPKIVPRIGLFARKFFYKRAAKKSGIIFTVSNFSRERIEKNLGVKNIVVTYTGIKESLKEYAAQNYAAQNYAAQKTNTVIYVGNIKKHKGISILIDAFQKIQNDGFNCELAIVGSGDNMRSVDNDILARLKTLRSARVTGAVLDAELYRLISGAALLVQPSFYEGFGLPPLEAMFLGTRALVSDIPVFREIYKDFPAVFFKSGDADDLAKKIKEILTAPTGMSAGIVSAGVSADAPALDSEQKNCYTFEKCAQIILKTLKSLN